MRQPHLIDSIEISRDIVRRVHADMPIGSGNIRQNPHHGVSSQERTAGWSSRMVYAAQRGSIYWLRDTVDGKWKNIILDKHEYSLVPNHEDDDIRRMVQKALNSTMFKAGNCTEMTSLAMVKWCQWIARIPDSTPIPFFSLNWIEGGSSTIDHACLSVVVNNESVMCDAWLKSVFKMNADRLLEWKKLFESAEVPPEQKKSVTEEEQALLWNHFLTKINAIESKDYIAFSITTREAAKRVAQLYERSLHEAVLQLYNDAMFDEKHMSSSLRWRDKFIQVYLNQHEHKATKSFYQRYSIAAIQAYLERYEVPSRIPNHELPEHFHLYLYLYNNKAFSPKPSMKIIADILTTHTYETLCEYTRIKTESLLGLRLYAVRVLARFDQHRDDKKAIALFNALSENKSLNDILNALKMSSSNDSFFWNEINDWEVMPKPLKDFLLYELTQHEEKRKRYIRY